MRCRPSRSDLRYGAYALGSSKLQVSTRIVVPAAVSGIVAAFVLGISRAIGETMIVLLAAGQQPNLSFDPREAVETMSAFIAATGAGDVPTGSVEYKTIFAVGATLFVMTLHRQRHFHPPRAQVPRGVRMSVAISDAPVRSGRRRGVWRGRIFVALLLLSMAVGFVALGDTASSTSSARASPTSTPCSSQIHPSSDPDIAGARPAILATLYLGMLLILFTVPIGVGTAIYLEEYADRNRWYNRLLELNIQNLAAVPSIVYGILGLAFLVRGLGSAGCCSPAH